MSQWNRAAALPRRIYFSNIARLKQQTSKKMKLLPMKIFSYCSGLHSFNSQKCLKIPYFYNKPKEWSLESHSIRNFFVLNIFTQNGLFQKSTNEVISKIKTKLRQFFKLFSCKAYVSSTSFCVFKPPTKFLKNKVSFGESSGHSPFERAKRWIPLELKLEIVFVSITFVYLTNWRFELLDLKGE